MKIKSQNLAYLSIFIFISLNSYFLFTVDSSIRSINDGYHILNLSNKLVFGKDYFDTLVTIKKPPLYIILVNFICKTINSNINFFIILQLVFALMTAIVNEKSMKYFLTEEIILFLLVVLLNPNLIAHANFILTEIIYSFFLTVIFSLFKMA